VRLIAGEAGGVILRVSPLKAVKVNGAAFEILKRCETGFSPESASCGDQGRLLSFLDTMWSAGVVRWTPSGDGAPPFVSIIVPVYNRAGQLGECLESLLQLNYPPDRREIIVVDDASTDNTVAVARSHGDAVKVLVQEKNRGQSAARNAGMAMAAGEIVAFLHSDSKAAPHGLSVLATC
jgi:hypothetical protein